MKEHAEKMNIIYMPKTNAEIAHAFGNKNIMCFVDNKNILVYRGAIDDNARNVKK